VGEAAGALVGNILLCTTGKDVSSVEEVVTLDLQNNDWKCTPLPATHQDSRLWEIESTTLIQEGGDDGLSIATLGFVKDTIRSTAIIRLEPFWLGVSSAKEFFYVAEDAILLLFLTRTGLVVSLLAFHTADDVYTVFRSGPNGEVQVAARNDSGTDAPYQILLATAESHKVAIEAVMSEARKRVSFKPSIKSLQQATKKYNLQSNDAFFDGLAFCTWNALGQDLTADKILKALSELSKNKITVPTLLIDDGWQSLGPTDIGPPTINFFKGFADFPAHSEFPEGLKGLTTQVRKQYPHIQNIGVWHAMYGYWGGISPGSPIAQKYKTRVVKTDLMGSFPKKILMIDPSDIHRFFDDFYAYLASQGVDFVKTDVQHMITVLSVTEDRRAIIHAYQEAWTLAVLKHFQGRSISCMSQAPEMMLHTLLQDKTPRILFRNSDDFFPEIPPSHSWHVFVNAYNALFTEHLNTVADWDMFQTSHPYSGFHAAARCISGGPVMITDTPGEHDIDLIEQMTARTPSGRYISLRPRPAKALNPWESFAQGSVLRIESSTRDGAHAVGILGLFNIAEAERHVLVAPQEFTGLKSKRFIVKSHRTGQIFGPIDRKPDGKTNVEDLIQLKLAAKGWDVLAAYPTHSFSDSAKAELAILGLEGKFTGAAAITSQAITAEKGYLSIKLTLRAVGLLQIWTSSSDINIKHARLGKGKDVSDKYVGSKVLLEDSEMLEVDLVGMFDDEKLWTTVKGVDEDIEVELALSCGTQKRKGVL
jgi:hypothetical protein